MSVLAPARLRAAAALAVTAAFSSPASAPAHATSDVSAAGVNLPAACRATASVVTPEGRLRTGVVAGSQANLYESGMALPFRPKALTFVGTSTNRGITIDRLLATDTSGRLLGLTVTERVGGDAAASVRLTQRVVARSSWQGVQAMTSTGPYLYATLGDGSFRRYVVGADLSVRSSGVIARTGWETVRSLSYGGGWMLPPDSRGRTRRADDVLALTAAGALKAYVIPRDTPAATRVTTLVPAGWGVHRYVGVGRCEGGKARPLIGVRPDGAVFGYLDRNGSDQLGSDIRGLGRATTGWTGVVGD